MPIHTPHCIRRLPAWLIACLFAVGAAGFFSTPVYGMGSEETLRGEDLNITVDSRWAGCAHGGYYPIRIRVRNLGPERTVRFTFETYNRQGLPQVSKAVRLKPNAELQFPLSIPMVGYDSSGMLHVSIDGSRKNSLQTSISLPDVDASNFDRPSMLVISNDLVDVERYEEAVTWLNFTTASSGSTGYGYYGGSFRSDDHEVISPNMLPERWIDYSGLDFVAISLNDFEQISSDARNAMVDWAKTGGNLIVYGVGEVPSESAKLADLTGLRQSAAADDTRWKDATAEKFDRIPLVEGDSSSGFSETAPANDPSAKPVWSRAETPFQVRDVLDGTIIAFPGSPFPGSRHEWAWMLKTLGPARYHWTHRHGMSARMGNNEFLYFMIPGLSGVPVIAFLILITAFSVVIGPLNYYFLTKRKRLYLLVITIPFIAFVTSISLFTYSILAHGFSTKSRIRSLTTVDQGTNESVTTARVSLYSGLAPSEGLEFTAETVVYPVWPRQGEQTFEAGAVDWTNQQALTAGWLKSRTRTQFYTVTKRDERGRLTVSPAANNSLEITNGFEYDIAHLLVRGDDGELYYGSNVRAGREAKLTPATTDEGKQITSLIREARPELPDNYDSSYDSGPSYSYPYYNYDFYTQFTRNTMEREIESLLAKPVDQFLGDRQYFGVLDENPDVPIGMSGTSEGASLHLLHRYY